MGFENLKSAFSQITNVSQISGRHGGLSGETPSQPPHPEFHSILDNINPYTNQFVSGFEYKNPNKGGLHGANIDFNGTPVLSTPFYEIEKMIRMHQELDVNIEGIDVVFNLLQKIDSLQKELANVRNRLRLYEN